MHLRKLFLSVVVWVMGIGGASQVSQAVVINGGWEIRVLHDAAQFVGVTVDAVSDDTLFIELDKIFSSPTFDFDQFGQSVRIEFTVDPQAASHVPNIVILDESIRNNTGRDWTDFHMALIDNDDEQLGPQVGFDPAYIYESTGDVPFDTIVFQGNDGLNGMPTQIDFRDGVLANGSDMAVGVGGTSSNNLRIVTNLQPGESFRLKEYPTVPEPASLLSLALGLGVLTRKVAHRKK